MNISAWTLLLIIVVALLIAFCVERLFGYFTHPGVFLSLGILLILFARILLRKRRNAKGDRS